VSDSSSAAIALTLRHAAGFCEAVERSDAIFSKSYRAIAAQTAKNLKTVAEHLAFKEARITELEAEVERLTAAQPLIPSRAAKDGWKVEVNKIGPICIIETEPPTEGGE
jgi:hypothetical protein